MLKPLLSYWIGGCSNVFKPLLRRKIRLKIENGSRVKAAVVVAAVVLAVVVVAVAVAVVVA